MHGFPYIRRNKKRGNCQKESTHGNLSGATCLRNLHGFPYIRRNKKRGNCQKESTHGNLNGATFLRNLHGFPYIRRNKKRGNCQTRQFLTMAFCHEHCQRKNPPVEENQET